MPSRSGPGARAGHFATTQWSLVLAAGDSAHPRFQDALGELCTRYWAPVRGFVRRRVGDEALADDFTQGFFAALLERKALAAADRDRGRFRAFLLTAVKYYLADQYDRARAQKRGGGRAELSLDDQPPDARRIEPPDPGALPDREYDRQWALTLLDGVRRHLDAELAAAHEPDRMRRLAALLTGGDTRYADVARELGMTESAVKVAVHRLRKRYAAILRQEVARTVDTPSAVDEELRFLLRAVST